MGAAFLNALPTILKKTYYCIVYAAVKTTSSTAEAVAFFFQEKEG